MKSMKLIVAIALAVMVLPSFAQPPGQTSAPGTGPAVDQPGPVEKLVVPGLGRVLYQRLFEMTSLPGEDLDGLVLRAAPLMRQYTKKQGYETCGVVATDGAGRFGVVVGTNRGHAVCLNFSGMTPSGMHATGQTIHSHGPRGTYTANRQDGIVVGMLGVGKVFHREEPEMFSEEDFESGHGYLVAPVGTWYQQGVGTERRIN